MIKDSGNRTALGDTGFVRDIQEGKGRMDLLPWHAIMELSKHCEEGAKKYGERNIDLGCPQHALISSGFRHLAKYTMGHTDENHLRAAFWNIAWALEQDVVKPEMQDIPAVLATKPKAPVKCVETTCYYNNDCICTANEASPELATNCPNFMED